MQNIIIKTYGDKRTLWVSEYYIVQRTGVSDAMLRKSRAQYKAGDRKCWRWDRINGGFYYAWETIPNKAPVCYQQSIGTYEELLMQGMGVKMSRADVLANGKQKLLQAYHEYEETTRMAIMFYNKHEYEYVHKHSTELAEAYTWCKVVLNYTYKEGKRWILLGCDKIADVYEIMVELLAERGLKALRASSITSLYNKIAGFSKLETTDDQYNYFVHNGVGNKNSVILCEEVKLAIQYLRGLGSNWSDNMIARKVIQMAINMSLPVPSERTIEEYMNTKAVQTIAEQGRHGVNGKFRRITNGSMPIALPLFAGDCWQMDGTRINMVSHVAEDGKERFLYIVAVRDVYSGEYLGWSYGYNEDHTMYINALQMACEATLHLPYELVRDKFPGHNTQAWKQIEESLIKYGVKITETHEAQGKAQMERAFGTLQSVFMANTPYYYGEGIRSTRRHAHRSAEYLQQLKKVRKQIGWDFDTACNVQDGIMERYNTTVVSTYSKRQIHYSPKELYAQSEQQNVIAIAPWQVARLFYLRKTIQIGAGGMIITEINKQKIYYQIEGDNHYDIVSTNTKVILLYDFRDLSRVVLLSEVGQYLCEVNEFKPVQVYGKAANFGALSHGKQLTRHVAEVARQKYEGVKLKTLNMLPADEMNALIPTYTTKAISEATETYQLEQGASTPLSNRDDMEEQETVGELTEEEMRKSFGDVYTQGNV